MLLRPAILGLMLLISGCQTSVTSLPDVNLLFHDEHFNADSPVPSADSILQLPPALASDIRHQFERARLADKGIQAHQWLSEYIRERDGGFQYRDHFTRSATETFHRREGNCLSLVVLTTALADALNVPVQFQEVEVEPVWDKWGQFYLINGHINIRLAPPSDNRSISVSAQSVLVDFLPERAIRAYGTHRVDQLTVMAMFYNNLAAEALVNSQPDMAYALAKMSIQLKPDFVQAINTLGVVYRRAGMADAAEAAYRYAVALSGENLNSLSNLALLLGEQGRLDEWAQIHRKLELARIRNPYYYYDMAEEAFARNDYSQALDWYWRAVKLADYQPEFFVGLSKSYWRLGDRDKAESNMNKAINLATDGEDRQRYQYKLKAMRRNAEHRG
ncbi:tetratricopeptide repeat protein [Shewanella sp. GXUN23E]|uniref:tetratricopeptide repeat protein n=1 Tax=Shewanella sp. GXUN23E TaxID=3422498 RepID=UPI003D7CA47B